LSANAPFFVRLTKDFFAQVIGWAAFYGIVACRQGARLITDALTFFALATFSALDLLACFSVAIRAARTLVSLALESILATLLFSHRVLVTLCLAIPFLGLALDLLAHCSVAIRAARIVVSLALGTFVAFKALVVSVFHTCRCAITIDDIGRARFRHTLGTRTILALIEFGFALYFGQALLVCRVAL
jgi:hypothetical protein